MEDNYPVLVEPHAKFRGVALRLEYFDYFQDMSIAILLSQIHYWYQPDKNGKSKLRVCKGGRWYLVKSYLEWYRETRLSQKQITRALSMLQDAGVIDVKVMRFAGNTINHITAVHVQGNEVLTEGNFLIPKGLLLSQNLPQVDSGNLPQVEFKIDPKETPITESTTETTTEINPLALQEPATQESQETDSIPTGEDMAKGPSSTSQILAMHKTGNTPAKTKTIIERAVTIWRTIPKFNDTVKFIPELTIKQKGQLKLIMKAWGDDAEPVMEFIVRNWVGYANHVKIQAGLKITPDAPQIGFLLKYAGDAKSYWVGKKSVQLIAPKKVQEEKSEKAPPQKKDGGDDQISLEDFLAL